MLPRNRLPVSAPGRHPIVGMDRHARLTEPGDPVGAFERGP
jgi:hypothetical protein